MPSFAGCDLGNLIISLKEGLVSQLSGNRSQMNRQNQCSINFPVMINDQSGCFKQNSGLSLAAKYSKQKSEVQIGVFPLSYQSHGIPEVQARTWFKTSLIGQALRISVPSVVCSGARVFSIDDYDGTLQLLMKQQSEMESRKIESQTFFATGAAAQILMKKMNLGISIPQLFQSELQSVLQSPIATDSLSQNVGQGEQPVIWLPSVLVKGQIQSNQLSDSYQISSGSDPLTGAVFCSSNFDTVMKSFQIAPIGKGETSQDNQLADLT